jgi:hypothetical protein
MVGYSVAQLDDIEEFNDAGCHYRPIRHHLGITAFGVTAWTAHAAGDRVINEHDEDDPTADQELFLVLRGHAVFEIDGERVDAPVGTLVHVPPRTRRTASASRTRRRSSPWKALRDGDTRPAAGNCGHRWRRCIRRAGTPRWPTGSAPWSRLLRSIRCCSSISPAARAAAAAHGDALDHLRHAIELSEEFRARPGRTPTSIRSATNPRSSN